MKESRAAQDERIRKAADQLCIEATHQSEFTRSRVLELAGGHLGWRALKRVFPDDQFTLLQQSWLRQRIENAIETAFQSANTQQDFTMRRIAELAGCTPLTVKKLARAQFDARHEALPDPDQRMLQAITRLVEAKILPQEFTWERVYKEAGTKHVKSRDKIVPAFEEGYTLLTQYHKQQERSRVSGAAYACIEDHWINVDEPEWYLPPLRRTLRRDRLRPDIAAIVWPQLRDSRKINYPS